MTAQRTVCGFCALTAFAALLFHTAEGLANSDLLQLAKPELASSFGKLPLSFEANRGQTDPRVQFLARGQGYTLFLLPTEAVLSLASPSTVETNRVRTALRMKLLATSSLAHMAGLNELPSKSHYFIGSDPKKWRINVLTYDQVRQKDIYPGIDLIYYGKGRQLEYDFIVSPGADPRVITLAFEGQQEMRIDASGDLLLETGAGQVQLRKPAIYQEHNGRRHPVEGSYVLRDKSNQVGIEVQAYDRSKPLTIDPILVYSTYLGGSNQDFPSGIKVDTAGNAYVTGSTNSSNFPTTAGSLHPSQAGSFDIFVTKLNPAGNGLVYSTYLGGSGNDFSTGIALDASESVYITGQTGSTNFPTTPGAFQPTLSGGPADAFVVKLAANGSSLTYSTYVGGTSQDQANAITVDGSGNAYITGSGQANFPATASAFSTTFIANDAEIFVTKLNALGTGLLYSTAIPGAHPATDTGRAIVVDAGGNAYVSGVTRAALGTAGAFQTSYQGGGSDGFVLKLNPTGSALVWATNLGSNGLDEANSLAIDLAGNVYVTGAVHGSNFPTTTGALQTTFAGGGGANSDTFVTKINSTGTTLVYSTYLGWNGEETSGILALDETTGIVSVVGGTTSTNLPVTPDALQPSLTGGFDVFVTKINATGSALLYASYLGGAAHEFPNGLAMDGAGNHYVAVNTGSSNFPTASGAFQTTFGGISDAAVIKLSFKPIANAGPDQSVQEGALVTLHGAGSTGVSLTYQWNQVSGPTVALSGGTTANPTFTAPHVQAAGATVTLDLVVCEGSSSNCSDPDSMNVHITNINQPPVADAGPDQTVQEHSPVILNGTGSYDPDIDAITYHWTQLFGPAVTLLNANTAHPTFTAPAVGATGATLVFDLTVTDPHNLTASDSISVFVTNINQNPVANAGPDQTVSENTAVTLNGTASYDPDLDTLHFTWTQTAGPPVALTGANTANPTFTAPAVGAGGATLTIQLVVSDGQASSAPDTVNVHVLGTNDPPVCTLAQPSLASLWPPNHSMMPVTITGVTDPNNHAITIAYTAVTQDEPVNGLGDGDTSPDAAVSGHQILLRAERSGAGNGRVYVVHFTASDGQGGSCNGTVQVSVPHSKKDTASNSGQFYNSFLP